MNAQCGVRSAECGMPTRHSASNDAQNLNSDQEIAMFKSKPSNCDTRAPHAPARIFQGFCQPEGVAQTSSLLYRGFPIRRCGQMGTSCRLEVGDTAGWKPALRPFAALLLLSLFLAAAGCVTSGPQARPAPKEPSSKARVDELDLVAMPVAVNLESKLGLNGIQVKIYAGDLRRPKTQPITEGTLEILMFEGLVGDSFDQTNRCRHLWSFPARDLLTSALTTSVGTGYLFPLAWGKDRPRADKITVVARYLPPQGPVIYSAPSYISIPPPRSPPPSAPPSAPPPKK